MSKTSLQLENQEVNKAIEAFSRISVSGSRHTQRAYSAALRYWAAWFALRHRQRLALPVEPAVVIQFLRDHLMQDPDRNASPAHPFQGPRSSSQHTLPLSVDTELVRRGFKGRIGPLPLSTVVARLSALSKAHKVQVMRASGRLPPNPLADPGVREHLKRCRTVAARVPRERRASKPLDRRALDALLETCATDLVGIRDRALLLLAWHAGGLKRSDLADARMAQFQLRDGRSYFELKPASKVHRRGLPDPNGLYSLKPLPPEAAKALRAWHSKLIAANQTRGALFRSVRHDSIGEPLTGEGIRQILKRRALLADLDVRKISPVAHSINFGKSVTCGACQPAFQSVQGTNTARPACVGYKSPSAAKLVSAKGNTDTGAQPVAGTHFRLPAAE